MEESLARQVVRAFVAKLNAHKPDGLYDLMTDDHLFVDTLGATRRGRDAARQWWIRFLNSVPDFYIMCDQLLSEGETIALFGRAGGTYSYDGRIQPENRWEVPAAWKVVVRGTRVTAWHVYADTMPIHEVIARTTGQATGGDAHGMSCSSRLPEVL